MMNKSRGGLGTIISDGIGDRFIRNTVRYNGASSGYLLGGRGKNRVELNHFHHQCWGRIQNDGSHVQTQIKAQANTLLTQNWIHDSPKYALRFDGQPPRVGMHGTMSRNVAMNTNGLMVKGDYHTVLNNLALDKYKKARGDRQGNRLRVVRFYVTCARIPFPSITIRLFSKTERKQQTVEKGKRNFTHWQGRR